jgi:hypothetical protein
LHPKLHYINHDIDVSIQEWIYGFTQLDKLSHQKQLVNLFSFTKDAMHLIENSALEDSFNIMKI